MSRPTVNSKVVDIKHPRIQQLVSDYVKWCDDVTFIQCSREEYENDIRSLFDEWNTDGYSLAKHLENKVGIEPDEELVEILSNFRCIKIAYQNELIKAWVTQNELIIPETCIGKKVNWKQNYKTGTGYITTIYSDIYNVTVSERRDAKGGYIINFENVTFVEDNLSTPLG